jgi:hypothetical protein
MGRFVPISWLSLIPTHLSSGFHPYMCDLSRAIPGKDSMIVTSLALCLTLHEHDSRYVHFHHRLLLISGRRAT